MTGGSNAAASSFTPSLHLRAARVDDSIILLDLRRGAYLLLDPVASAMWNGLITVGLSDESLLAGLLDRFDARPEQLRQDLAAFRRRCFAQNLAFEGSENSVAPTEARNTRPRRVLSPGFAAWRCIVEIARMLRRRGFGETYRVAVELAPAAPDDHVDPDHLRSAVAAFSHAENFVSPDKSLGDCLPRSIALFRFLRIMGLPAEHVIGVARHPFLAHAWVECDGRVILDADPRPKMSVLSAVAPLAVTQ